MINVSEAYKKACESNNRVSYVIAKYGLYDARAKGNISNVNANNQAFSDMSKTYNEIKKTNYNYISCEPNRVRLNGSFYFINDKNSINSNEYLAYWSKELSNENCYFTTNPKIVYQFTDSIDFTDLTLYFQEVCEEFNVKYFLNDQHIVTREIRNNKNLNPVTSQQDSPEITNVLFNKIEIEFIKTNEPYRYIKFNEIDFGILHQFNNEQIVDFDIIDELSIDSSELSANSLNLSIDNSSGEYDILNPKNKLNLLQENQEITLYHYLKVGNTFQEVPLGTFLLKDFSVNNQTLEVEAFDDTYFMNKYYYGSKLYTNEEITNIFKDVFDYFNYSNYILDDELKGIKLTGFIPVVEMREALRLIAEAGKCVISKNRYGKTYIYKTYDPLSKTFTRNLIFEETPNKNLYDNVVDVVSYNYDNKTENHQIFNSNLPVGKHIIEFNDCPVIENTIVKENATNEDYEILNKYTTSCVINVIRACKVALRGTLIKPTKIIPRFKKNNVITTDYSIPKIDNKLITNINVNEVGNWKLNRSEIKYSFNTITTPYIEVGDTCNYETRFNTRNTFIPTRIEFTKSLIQNIEGE